MVIRTFYWDPALRNRPRWRRRGRSSRWQIGNAGDLFNRDLLDHLYGVKHRIVDDGPRLLPVGSIAHRVKPGDVVAGSGSKGVPVPPASEVSCRVLGVRGPRTHEAFVAAGHDVSTIRFEGDPGLLLPDLLTPQQRATQAVTGRTIFIPHYKDPAQSYAGVDGVETVSIDAEPAALAVDILRAEHVYASSLHGVIFAHALGRPCTPVAPASNEPLIKYDDYFASIGVLGSPAGALRGSLADAAQEPKPDSPVDRTWTLTLDDFPTLAELKSWGVA